MNASKQLKLIGWNVAPTMVRGDGEIIVDDNYDNYDDDYNHEDDEDREVAPDSAWGDDEIFFEIEKMYAQSCSKKWCLYAITKRK